ncbi:FG-GAP repeat domain-containing protein, partial [Streptomyces lushanensis]|uniref:FG-GAP repeat domain-containing protein n=1 Tax=Streptomyces lushanensis TaxID=1434255 RepID=UPI0014756AD6
AVAGVGARIVAENQEHLVAAVWEQVAQLHEANRVLRQAQLARDAGTALHEKRIGGGEAAVRGERTGAPTADGPRTDDARADGARADRALPDGAPARSTGALSDASVLGLTSAVHGSIPAAQGLTGAPAVSQVLAANPAVAAAATLAFRKAARTPASTGSRPGADTDTAVNALAANEITPAPPARLPAGGVPEGMLRDPSGSPFSLEFFDPALVATADPWWKPPGPVPPNWGDFEFPAEAAFPPVVTDDGRAFVLATNRRLYELTFVLPGERRWRDHGEVADAYESAGVAGLAMADGGERLFITFAQGPKLVVERRREGDRWRWITHRTADPGVRCTAPAVAGSSLWVTIGDDLWQMRLDTGEWIAHGRPPVATWGGLGRPAPMADGTSVFVILAFWGLGHLCERRLDPDRVWRWYDRYRPGGTETALFLPDTLVPVRYASDTVRLVEGVHELAGPRALDVWEYDRPNQRWRSLGRPAEGSITALAVPQNRAYQYAVLDDGRVAVASGLTGPQRTWTVRGENPAARAFPWATEDPRSQNHVFVVSKARGLALSGPGAGWIDYGQPKDLGGQGGAGDAAPADRWRFAPRIGLYASMLVATLDQPGPASAVRLRVGRDLGFDAAPRAGWTPRDPSKQSPPFRPEARGLGVALADLTGNGRPDLIAFTVQPGETGPTGVYRIGRDVAPDGTVTGGWSETFALPDPMPDVTACDIAVADLDRDGRPELIVGYASAGQVSYRVGWGLGATGAVGNG